LREKTKKTNQRKKSFGRISQKKSKKKSPLCLLGEAEGGKKEYEKN